MGMRKLRARLIYTKAESALRLIISRHIRMHDSTNVNFGSYFQITYSNIYLVLNASKMCHFSEYFGHLVFDFNAKFRVIFSHFLSLFHKNI